MYHILPQSEGNVIGIQVIDGLKSEDYATLFNFTDQCIDEYGTIRVLSDLRELKHVYFWEEFKVLFHRLRIDKNIEKQAVISDEAWINALTKITAPLFKTEIRVFPSTEIEEAWKWVRL